MEEGQELHSSVLNGRSHPHASCGRSQGVGCKPDVQDFVVCSEGDGVVSTEINTKSSETKRFLAKIHHRYTGIYFYKLPHLV